MKRKFLKRSFAAVVACSLIFTGAGFNSSLTYARQTKSRTTKTTKVVENKEKHNYAVALQESLYFYDANMCGKQSGRLNYRDECHMCDAKVPLIPKNEQGYGTNLTESFIEENKKALDPDGDNCIDVSGGFHDAGDHVKFGLPQSYSGATLGWGYYEFPDSYKQIHEDDHMEDILRHFNDYFMRCTFMDDNDEVVAFCYQVGDGTSDHCYWGSPELQTTPRPVWLATKETPASDQCAGAAASLAINYMNFKNTDKAYANKCLKYAKALYEFAVENRGLGFSGGFYNSSYDEDELSWAAVWLNIATGEQKYIDDITSVDESGMLTGYMKKIINSTSDTWQNIWVHSWDTVWGGVFAKLAPITNDPAHWYYFRWNIEYWSHVPHKGEQGGSFIATTPGGFSVISTWGSARYNAAAQLCALVYNKYEKEQRFVEWSKSQMDYILGDNPFDKCLAVGYASNSSTHPHHRASHGSTSNSLFDPVESKHILYGALCGGPDGDEKYIDDRNNYIYNEVAIDYNAGYVAALGGLYEQYGKGQKPLEKLVQLEDEKPFFSEAKIEQENNERTQVTVCVHNDTSCPPRLVDTLKARYFFNISELLAKGQTIDDVKAETMYDQSSVVDHQKASISGPFAWDEDNGIYYVEIDWSGVNFHGSREYQFALVAKQDSTWKSNWDGSNDESRIGLTSAYQDTPSIPVYEDGKLVYGEEPGAGIKKPTIKLSANSVVKDNVVDCTKGDQTVTFYVKASDNENISKVSLYVNGELVKTDTKAPYAMKYRIDKMEDLTDSENFKIEAKATLTNNATVKSNVMNIKAIYNVPAGPTIEIVSPADRTVLDTTKGDTSLKITVKKVSDENIKYIHVYADGKLVDRLGANGGTVTYKAPTGESANASGKTNVEIVATATLDSGKSVPSKPITIVLVQKVNPNKAVALQMDVEGKGTDKNTTVQRNYKLTNSGSTAIDLSKVKIRYYMTKDDASSLVFFCDSAGMNVKESPWYYDMTSKIKGTFVNTTGNDCYYEVSFDGVDQVLPAGCTMLVNTRVATSSWSMMDQTNDYSYEGKDAIALIYNNEVIQGSEK